MKKLLFFALLCSAVVVILVGCGAPKPRAVALAPRTADAETPQTPQKRTVEVEITTERDKHARLGDLLPIVGVRRRIATPSGEYTVEYVHYPQGVQKDESLYYSLTLNGDNTYEMTVVTDGVQANHYGNWYLRSGGSLVMYYDEPIDNTAHNVFVADCMYGEMLPHGKIMIYDNGNVIVLSKPDLAQTPRLLTFSA